MLIENMPDVETAMLIRRPVEDVFNAFIDPAITTKFWFTKSSGKLDPGKNIKWTWDMYNFSVDVRVQEIETNKRILVEWGHYKEATLIEWIFIPRLDDTTFVTIKNSGFKGTGDEIIRQTLDSTEGFSLLLAGAKALLEHNILLNLVPDRFPEGYN
ncbi:MAG: SRPBCC family protein [Emcibacteraceae bacterium]